MNLNWVEDPANLKCVALLVFVFCCGFFFSSPVLLNNSKELFHKVELLSFCDRVREGCCHRSSVFFESHYVVDGMVN